MWAVVNVDEVSVVTNVEELVSTTSDTRSKDSWTDGTDTSK